MGMGTVGIPWGWKLVLRDSRKDGTKLCGIPAGMYLFEFNGAPVSTKMVFKLLKDVCSDFMDTNCIIIS